VNQAAISGLLESFMLRSDAPESSKRKGMMMIIARMIIEWLEQVSVSDSEMRVSKI
jgi:hypothetical protein